MDSESSSDEAELGTAASLAFEERKRKWLAAATYRQPSSSESSTEGEEEDDNTKDVTETLGKLRITQWSDDDSSIEIVPPTRQYPSSTDRRQAHQVSTNKSQKDKEKVETGEGHSAWVSLKDGDYVLDEKQLFSTDYEFPAFRIPAELYERLFPHQRHGVQWMASLHCKGVGGVLGDDMGLGKTYQTLTFLGGLMRARTIRNALIVMPVSLLRAWEREANVVIRKECVTNLQIAVVNSEMSKRSRINVLRGALKCTRKNPTLVITTYGMIQSGKSNVDFMSRDHGWDYVVCDEGHKIKNSAAQITKACHRLCQPTNTHRLLLTGTPIQNNMKELWCLFDWACSGRLFGTYPKFKRMYGQPIEEGRNRSATTVVLRNAESANRSLRSKLEPHFLQRHKSTILKDLPKKKEYIVWTHLSTLQRKLYSTYIGGQVVNSVLMGEVKSPLEAVTWLKKLCGHPLLVSEGPVPNIKSTSPRKLLDQSAKLQVLSNLISDLCIAGHRTLVFSQSTKILDMIETVLTGLDVTRIDGSVKERDRQRMVDEMNDPSSGVQVMLLSTKAGGLGLTLTGADRAVIYDPSWNPAEDAQAVDRCFRIGQKKEVKVFRFVAAGTVEEKMLEKQVHKDGLNRTVTMDNGNNVERFFDNKDLRKLFTLGSVGECAMLEVVGSAADSKHLLSSPNGVIGISSYDSIYKQRTKKPIDGTERKHPKVLGRAQRVLKEKPINSAQQVRPTKQKGCGNSHEVENESIPDYRGTPQATDAVIARSTVDNANQGNEVRTRPPAILIRRSQLLLESGNVNEALDAAMAILEERHADMSKEQTDFLSGIIEDAASKLGFYL